MKDRILRQLQSTMIDETLILNYDSIVSDLIDSITFINMVVALEKEFGFEFDDDMLLMSLFPTFETMIDYVISKIVS